MRRCVFRDEEVENPLPQTSQTCGFSPVCVRRCLFSRDGRSNVLPQKEQGSIDRSRAFFTMPAAAAAAVSLHAVASVGVRTGTGDRESSGVDGEIGR